MNAEEPRRELNATIHAFLGEVDKACTEAGIHSEVIISEEIADLLHQIAVRVTMAREVHPNMDVRTIAQDLELEFGEEIYHFTDFYQPFEWGTYSAVAQLNEEKQGRIQIAVVPNGVRAPRIKLMEATDPETGQSKKLPGAVVLNLIGESQWIDQQGGLHSEKEGEIHRFSPEMTMTPIEQSEQRLTLTWYPVPPQITPSLPHQYIPNMLRGDEELKSGDLLDRITKAGQEE